jgi:hypothetical protein
LKVAERSARMEERKYYSKVVERYKSNAEVLSSKVVSLTSSIASSELQRKRAEAQVNRSTRRSAEVSAYNVTQDERIKELEAIVKKQNSQLMELEEEIESKKNEVQELEKAFPIKVFAKIRGGQRGATSWPHFVWELILEQLVNGTPPSAVNSNIVSFLRCFSPMTVIKELPSIWTIRRGRTVLLTVVETLATYRLAKAKRWGQMFTDGSGRRQIALQDLALSIEEDIDGVFE